MPTLSIIIPVLNEGERIAATLGRARAAAGAGRRGRRGRRRQPRCHRPAGATACRPVISAPRGRATQMNAGAEKATGDILLFLHGDTRLPSDADHVLLNGLERSGRAWGRFDVRIDSSDPAAAHRRPHDEFALAAHRHRHRRPGDLRQARRVPEGRRLPADRADGGHRAVQAAQARRPAAVPARTRHHLRRGAGRSTACSAPSC